MPKISVIIPTYQHGTTIAACLDSVFNQTIFNPRHREAEGRGDLQEIASPATSSGSQRREDIATEVIVVNDGSTDQTQEVLKNYSGKIKIITTENLGAPQARNTGFAASTGEYVIFLDADVVMNRNMLAILLKTLEANPSASYAYSGFKFGLGRFKAIPWEAEQLKERNFIHTSALIRRVDFPGFDQSIKKLQDWDLWLTMMEQGKIGVSAGKILFVAKPRGKFGMSVWLPKFFYSDFFATLGIKIKAVIRYNEAAATIRKKHRLPETKNTPQDNRLWFWFLAVFAVSALSFNHKWMGTAVSLIILAVALKTALKRLIYGVSFVLAELIFGSLAGKTLVISFFGFNLPLRLALFGAIGIVWLVRVMQKRARLPAYNLFAAIVGLLLVVGLGIMNGIFHHISLGNVFSDANAYFALPIILFFYSAVESEDDQKLLVKILKSGAIALSIITIIALYFFSHKFPNSWGVYAYKWLRDSRIAEVTALSGGLYRVFIQSQIFCLLAFFMAIFYEQKIVGEIKRRFKLKSYAWAVLPAAALIISGSRSFALGVIIAVLAWFVLALSSLKRDRTIMGTVKKTFSLLLGGAIIYGLALFLIVPAPRSQTSFQDMLASRQVSIRDAATVSRWSLLSKLNEKIVEAPFLGSGFGTTVTYQSSDPRIIDSTGGAYTTSAFEWNYHDIVIKMGLLGLLAYAYLLYVIFIFLNKTPPEKRIWLVPSFFALLALNAVSPFLNHPLGIGFLALLLALAEGKREVAVPVAAKETFKIKSSTVAAVPGLAMTSEE